MKKTFISIFALLFTLTTGAMANGIEQTQDNDYNIHEQNTSVYVLLGTFDFATPDKESPDSWGRAHKPHRQKIDEQGRVLHPEYEFSEDLLDAVYDGLALGRRTKTEDIQSKSALDQFLRSHDEDTYALDGVILKMESATKYNNNTKGKQSDINSITATIRVRYNLVNLRTNQIISTFEQERTGNSTYRPNIGDAMRNAFKSITSGIKFKLNDIFPSYGYVVKADQTKKTKVETLYIDLGTDDRVEQGNHFEVKTVTYVDGKPIYKNVGKIKVLEEQGPTTSKCKVVSGGSKIYSALQEQSTLVIESYNGFWE